jgi:Lipocalin-like domain
MKKVLLVASIGLLLFTACKKKDDAAPTTCELTTAGITGTYKLTKVELNTGAGFSDVTNVFLDACEKDDLYNFNAAGVFILTDAGVACSPSGTSTGTWSVTSSKLTFSSPGLNGVDLTNATLSDNNCKSFIATESAGGFTTRATFTK